MGRISVRKCLFIIVSEQNSPIVVLSFLGCHQLKVIGNLKVVEVFAKINFLHGAFFPQVFQLSHSTKVTDRFLLRGLLLSSHNYFHYLVDYMLFNLSKLSLEVTDCSFHLQDSHLSITDSQSLRNKDLSSWHCWHPFFLWYLVFSWIGPVVLDPLAHFPVGFQRNYTSEVSRIDIFIAAVQTSFSSQVTQYLLNYSWQDGHRLPLAVAVELLCPHHPLPKCYCREGADASFSHLKN